MHKIALYRKTPHVIVDTGIVGPNPDVSDGKHYSHQPESKIADLCWGSLDEARANGHWVPDHLLEFQEQMHSFGAKEAIEEVTSTRDMVLMALNAGPVKIGPLASELGRPSAAVHSCLSSMAKKGEVVHLVDSNSWVLPTASAPLVSA